jgi:hypothetical protein
VTRRATSLAAALVTALAACGGSSSDPEPCAGGVDDGNACTADGCDASGAPVHLPVESDDGDPCTADSCDPVTGVSNVAIDPDDGVACTIDSCHPVHGVDHFPDDSACGTGEICDASAGCIPLPAIDFCILDFPFDVSAAPGTLTGVTRGDVTITGVTEAEGPSPLVHAEVGYGPSGSDPRGGTWTWATAGYRRQGPGYDEYEQPILAPFVAGTYAFTFRFGIQGGSWVYCDDDGASQAQDDFDPLAVGEMIVAP